MGQLEHLVQGLLDAVGVVGLQGLLHLGDGLLDARHFLGGAVLLVVLHGLFNLVHRAVGPVAQVDVFLLLVVLLLELLGVLDHLLDVRLAKP